jgi:class 3 adenylate cyclase
MACIARRGIAAKVILIWSVAAITAGRIALVRYIYVDIVKFTLDRSVEAQVAIMESLSRCVRQALAAFELDGDRVVYLPTGDGVCICLIDQREPYDLDIRVAVMLLESVYALSLAEVEEESRYAIRVGLNENQDNVVVDIGGRRRNFVGLGVNNAQRLMSLAAPFQLLMGAAVYQRLAQRRLYRPHLYSLQGIVKHGKRVLCYGYHDPGLACFASATARRPGDVVEGATAARPVSPPLQLPLREPSRAVGKDHPRTSFKI